MTRRNVRKQGWVFPVIFSQLRWPIEPKFSQVCYFLYQLWYTKCGPFDNTVYRKCPMDLISITMHFPFPCLDSAVLLPTPYIHVLGLNGFFCETQHFCLSWRWSKGSFVHNMKHVHFNNKRTMLILFKLILYELNTIGNCQRPVFSLRLSKNVNKNN